MRKKTWIILSCIGIFLVGIVVTIFLLKDKNGVSIFPSSISVFPPSNKISCISVNGNDNPYQANSPKAYTMGKKVLDGHSYDGSNAEEFVYGLIKSSAISTFVHASADVCLTSYQESDQKITLGYNAQQIYYTSKKNVEIYSFTVEINRIDKSITIKGE